MISCPICGHIRTILIRFPGKPAYKSDSMKTPRVALKGLLMAVLSRYFASYPRSFQFNQLWKY
ncbi:hypothetical protein LB504_009098 [Fusarium proliferatum]|nr:hypothetical protein LB504_009098 [Fusarium proliferatum]